jgi:hypothetical protein
MTKNNNNVEINVMSMYNDVRSFRWLCTIEKVAIPTRRSNNPVIEPSLLIPIHRSQFLRVLHATTSSIVHKHNTLLFSPSTRRVPHPLMHLVKGWETTNLGRSPPFSQASRPMLYAVKDVQDSSIVLLNAMNHNIGQARQDQLPGSFFAPGSASTRSGT